MHELSYAREVYKRVATYARQKKAKRVYTVTIAVSAMSGIEPDSFRFYWETLTKGTLLLGSKIRVRRLPSSRLCRSCTKTSQVRDYEDQLPRCVHCGSIQTIPTEAIDVQIRSIQIEI